MAETWDWLGVVGVSIVSALAVEFICWLIIYRLQNFQSLRVSLAKQAKKLEEIKAAPVAAGKLKSKQKKERQIEISMRNDSAREGTLMKLKQALVTAALVYASYKVMGTSYAGKVVARLPFKPFSLLAKITHRGLAETDGATACSWAFIFAMCQTGIRANLSKLLDLGPSRQMLGLSGMSMSPMGEEASRK